MNPNYLDLLPDEMILKILLETDDLKTLSKWCQTSKRVNQICKDEGFWHNKYRKDYGFRSSGNWGLSGEIKLIEGETWREKYKQRTLDINSPISVGYNNYGIIDKKGILYMAGENGRNQLGNGTTINSIRPTVLPFNQKIIGISCTTDYTAALTEDGKIYLWGDLNTINNMNQIDQFITGIEKYEYNQMYDIPTPRLFDFPHPVIKMHAGEHNLGIITADHTPYFTNYIEPINIKALHIESTEIDCAIIGTDRKLYMWNFIYDYIEGETIDLPKYVPLPELIKQMSFGVDHYAVLSVSGNVYIWGSNEYGELGLPVLQLKVPTKIYLPTPVSSISMIIHSSAALTSGGKLYMWGANFDGMILNENHVPDWVNLKFSGYGYSYVPRPIQIAIEGKVINHVEIGSGYTLAVTDDGVVNYWGNPDWAPE